MQEFEQELNIELEYEDIVKTSLQIFRYMNIVRNNSINNNKISNFEKDEYLHLTQRLASCIENIVDDKSIENIQSLANIVNDKEKLINYDTLQTKFWKKENNQFEDTLKTIVENIYSKNEELKKVNLDYNINPINLGMDNISYHLFQAIKYIDKCDEEENIRTKTYNTILPHQKPIEMNKENQENKIETKDNLISRVKRTIRIDNVKDELTDLIEEAKEQGYTYLDVKLKQSELKELIENNKYLDLIYINSNDKYAKIETIIKFYNTSLENQIKKNIEDVSKYFCKLNLKEKIDGVEKTEIIITENQNNNQVSFDENIISQINTLNDNLEKFYKNNTVIDFEKEFKNYFLENLENYKNTINNALNNLENQNQILIFNKQYENVKNILK
jgi:hypothetical protein